MLSLTHTIVSLPIGTYFSNPIIIIFLALSSHYILDAIFHWNIYPPQLKNPILPVAADIVSGLALAWIIVGNNIFSLPIIIAIIASNTPDVIQALWFIAGQPTSKRFRLFTLPLRFHDKIQWETNNIAPGLISQLILISLSVLLVV